MLIFVLLLCHFTLCGHCVCVRKTLQTPDQDSKVFVVDQEANTFLGRRLLLNRFDFEILTPGNLERECYEEVCSYEEAREVFENIPDTDDFWKKYKKDQGESQSKVDVTALLVGIITAGVFIVIVGLLIWYFCQGRNKDYGFRGSFRRRSNRSNASVIIRRLEEVSLHPIPHTDTDASPDAHGLPSYEQAIAINGPHDAPPPPYPGSRPGSIRR
ncbi:transmembrane gamma-carboxyglutamic acid protein 4-like [Carassius auratus]|uniref:Transmembrane gamma-carboxyglutamic acid protein 4-like n=1 Tax=Carassius auratus TaxID=7957 RepID=A0A6P6RE83_CARAU|nr:transmembrane gamma-carboxyglutamic acid protein 4-like [Carassius auratus]XP_026143781.1 transmembrane gamma-carboxyglutamic acid protein 4-like [Carassius auratus]XP_026143782.1 transmembrane gamma-carboxyglutamic acid protein 4-like [Carassius auratus]